MRRPLPLFVSQLTQLGGVRFEDVGIEAGVDHFAVPQVALDVVGQSRWQGQQDRTKQDGHSQDQHSPAALHSGDSVCAEHDTTEGEQHPEDRQGQVSRQIPGQQQARMG